MPPLNKAPLRGIFDVQPITPSQCAPAFFPLTPAPLPLRGTRPVDEGGDASAGMVSHSVALMGQNRPETNPRATLRKPLKGLSPNGDLAHSASFARIGGEFSSSRSDREPLGLGVMSLPTGEPRAPAALAMTVLSESKGRGRDDAPLRCVAPCGDSSCWRAF
jgi:hypothetical protein